MTELSERQFRWILGGGGIGCYALLLMLEVLTDDEMTFLDFIGDAAALLLTIGAAVGVALLVQRMQAQHEERMTLIRDLDVARSESESWRAKVESHLAGIRVEMDKQFQEWGMTAAEQEIGMLILKGLSHKEIAMLRATSDATVRQQAQSVYRKAGVPGKTAFSAYFLDGLFVPEAATGAASGNPSMAS